MEWQPIETAPKDGVFILLAGGYFYCEARDDTIRQPCVASFDGIGDYWLIAGTEGGYVCVNYCHPTHWMPLPNPPAPHNTDEAKP